MRLMSLTCQNNRESEKKPRPFGSSPCCPSDLGLSLLTHTLELSNSKSSTDYGHRVHSWLSSLAHPIRTCSFLISHSELHHCLETSLSHQLPGPKCTSVSPRSMPRALHVDTHVYFSQTTVNMTCARHTSHTMLMSFDNSNTHTLRIADYPCLRVETCQKDFLLPPGQASTEFIFDPTLSFLNILFSSYLT